MDALTRMDRRTPSVQRTTMIETLQRTSAPLSLLSYRLLDESQCSRLIEECASLPRRDGLIYGLFGGGARDPARYKAREVFIDLMPPFDWLRPVLQPALVACLDHFRIPGLVAAEMPRLLTYEVGGHFAWHVDAPPGHGRVLGRPSRQITASIQLSHPEDYVGGDLLVKVDGEVKTAPRARGNVVMFPAEWEHQASPVESGTRVALVFWGYA